MSSFHASIGKNIYSANSIKRTLTVGRNCGTFLQMKFQVVPVITRRRWVKISACNSSISKGLTGSLSALWKPEDGSVSFLRFSQIHVVFSVMVKSVDAVRTSKFRSEGGGKAEYCVDGSPQDTPGVTCMIVSAARIMPHWRATEIPVKRLSPVTEKSNSSWFEFKKL